MVNASDRESCAASYPYVLAYFFSTVDEGKTTSLAAAMATQKPSGDSEDHWLSIGVRFGGGTGAWGLIEDIYEDEDDEEPTGTSTTTIGYLNIGGSLLIGVNILPQFTIQVEANVNAYFDFEEHALHWSHLTIPLLFKYNMRNDPIKASIYAGPYISLPLEFTEFPYDHMGLTFNLIGISAGVSAGRKLGPGYFFADARLNHLLFFSDDGTKHPFSGVVISIGYEFGLIKKK
jgi:hypothetical protein